MKKHQNIGKRWLSLLLAFFVVLTTVFPETAATTVKAAGTQEEPYVVSVNRPVYASSEVQSAGFAVDGDLGTRWESDAANATDWIYVDLGKETQITGIYLKWEDAAARTYRIQFSNDEIEWQDKKTVTDGKEAEERTFTDINGKARYVRIQCDTKATNYGYSLFEFQVYGLDGLTPRPVDYGTNLALHKTVEASSVQKEWWMIKKDSNGNEVKDDNGNPVYNQENVCPENAVDGVVDNKAWHSSSANANKREDDQWLCVDLGQEYEIGRIKMEWGDSARAYQIQVSNDKNSWTTIYSMLNGHAVSENIPVYAKARYVRIYCIASWGFNGFGIKELEVYQYRAGEEKKTYSIEKIPEIETVSVAGSGATYATDDIRFPMAKPPIDLAEELQMPNQPVASNDWWQTMTITDLGEGLVVLPFRVKHTSNGLSVIGVNDCWYAAQDQRLGALGSAVVNSKTDFYLTPEGMDVSSLHDEVIAYSDYSVTAQLYDAKGVVMTNTFTKGSPYLFSEFNGNQDILIYSNNISGIFGDNGQELLEEENKEITVDHFGIEISDDDNKAGKKEANGWFCISLPENTTVKRIGSKIKIHFASAADTYVSVGTMTERGDLKVFYEHGYAFIRNTSVSYKFDEATSKINTYYHVETDVKRAGFSGDTMQALFPHQWKKKVGTAVADTYSYVSSRGIMKAIIGNDFETEDTFYGMVPQFTTPQNEEYNAELTTKYLAKIEENTHNKENLPGGDAYWQGKSLHPLALAALVADQSGNMEYRDLFLERLRYIFDDWFTYSGEEDDVYFYYDKNWGTLYYRYSEFGANTGICDHHFTYGYFLFAASVLATYDEEFYEEYKEMLDLIVRDFASPYADDDLFCRFRSYDLYEGHSWAGGYADNGDGNNQEAGGESLFGWVGMYLWSIRSGNRDFRDAAIFGFTTELNAVEQYWFNYDGDNWPEDYPHYIVGQNYGATIFYGTFFDGNATSIYGIHWLPVTEWITHYSMGDNKAKLQKMYEGFLKEVDAQKAIEQEKENPGNVTTPLTGWQHLFVPFRSQYDPDAALEDYWKVVNGEVKNGNGDVVVFDGNEQYNAYWFANAMKDLGTKTTDIYAIKGASASVYKKGDTYTALAWNPTEEDITIQFTDGQKIVGSATIGAGSLVRLNPLAKNVVQVSTPEFSLASGTYEDTQYLKISTATEGAKIHYTTDGSNPTKDSPVYTGRIAISSTATVKAIAVKDGCIDSGMQAVTITIEGSTITTGKNIAVGKNASASTENGGDKAANVTDGNGKTRWQAAVEDKNEWCQVDLGKEYNVNKVKLSWEASYASKYEIQVSSDGKNWKTVYEEKAGNGKIDEIIFDVTPARYVRMQAVERATAYGASIYEFGIYEARKITKPEFSLAEGAYTGNQTVYIASGTKGVEIRYTTDGTEPNEKSSLYIPGLILWKDVTVKAKAFKKGMIPSETAVASYQIAGGTEPSGGDNYDDVPFLPSNPDKPGEEETLDGETGETVDDPWLKTCLSYQKNVVVSSSENKDTAANVTDGNFDSGWSSAFKEEGDGGAAFDEAKRFDQWCYIDLGESVTFNEVKIKWITSDNQYKIQISDDAQNWKDVCTHTRKTTENKVDVNRFDAVTARYVKMQGIKVGQAWGYSLGEMMVYFSQEEQPLGSNVALDSAATATSGNAEYLNDGDTATEWRPGDNNNQIVTLDLFKTYKVNKVVLSGTEDYQGRITVWCSKDGNSYSPVLSNVTASEDGTYKFDEQEVRYVRIEFGGDIANLSVKEFEVYTTGSADTAEVNVAYYNRAGADASSTSQGAVQNIVDGDEATFWQAGIEDTEAWCYIDLGEKQNINLISVDWQAAYADTYDIYLTDDIEAWKSQPGKAVCEGEQGINAGRVETILPTPVKARYVVIQQTKASDISAAYGCAVYEVNAGYRDAIPVERVEVGPSAATLTIGQSLTATCIVSPANADNVNVIWESDNETAATVNEKGVIKAKAAGIAKITAVSAADATKAGVVEVSVVGPLKTPKLTVKNTGETEITVSWTEVEHAQGYYVYRSKSRNGNYTKLNEAPLTETVFADKNLDKGSYYYKVQAAAPENDKIYRDSALSTEGKGTITVQAAVKEVELSLDSTSRTIQVGETFTITAAVTPEDTTVTWMSGDDTIATVQDGAVTGVKEGTVIITAMAGNKTADCEVTVVKDSGTVPGGDGEVTPPGDDGNQGGTTPPGDSGNQGEVTPPGGGGNQGGTTPPGDDGNQGEVTPPGEGGNAGEVTPPGDGENQNGTTPETGEDEDATQPKVTKVTLAVSNRPYGIKKVYIKKKGKLTLKANVEGTKGFSGAVVYSSSNKKIVSVNQKGQVKAGNKTGTATITVRSAADSTKKAAIKIQVVAKEVPNKVLKVKNSSIKLKAKGAQAQIRLKKYTKNTTQNVTYKIVSGKKYVKVDACGVVTSKVKPGKKAVKAKIQVTCGNKKEVVTVTIGK